VELYAAQSIRSALSVADRDEIEVRPDRGQDVLNDMRESWAADRRFFSNKGKEDREKWVVAEFLRLRGIAFQPNELVSPEQDHFVDVRFRSARFQVKEITDPNTRRQAEIAATHNQLLKAKRLQDAVDPGFAYDIPKSVAGDTLVFATVTELAQDPRYLQTKSQTDLLVYVTHTRATPPRTWKSEWPELSICGWRSVSCVIGDTASVLFAGSTSPPFLRVARTTQE
jgi:hypothetical protein